GPPDAGFNRDEPVRLSEVSTNLEAMPLILAGRPGRWRSLCEAACTNAERKFKPTVFVESAGLMIDLVADGLGYCLMSHESIKDALAVGKISAAPVRDQTVSWVLAVSRKRPFSPAIRELKRITLEAFQDWA